jgi:ABC-type antimicrobial peptide transport system permease subunit
VGNDQRAGANWVSPRYFETLGIPLFEGREFSPRDDANSLPVVIISRTMVRRYTGTDHAVGRHVVFNSKSYEVIGVAKDAKRGDLRESVQPLVYFSSLQSGSAVHALEVRTATSPTALAPDVRRVVRDVDPQLRIVAIATLQQIVNQKLGREILVADLAGFFAGLTLMLVILGVYGTVAYSVARRMKEIGVRIVLGARPANIAGIVLRPLVFAIGAGVIVGTPAAIVASRLVKALLFGLKATDVQTISTAVLTLCLAALTAGYLPVRRALRLDPTNALRLE